MRTAPVATASSETWATIYARRRENFRYIAQHGIAKAALDEFESLLGAAGTLIRPSLIVRCKVAGQRLDVRVITDKPLSQWRLTQIFVPFLNRVLPRTAGCAEFFTLMSDNIYVSEPAKAQFVSLLKRVPFLRCDEREDDEISSHAILIPDFNIQETRYASELIAIEEACSQLPFEQRREMVKWRGTLSGPDQPKIDNLADFPRYRLLMMSLEYPSIVDARLTTYYNLFDSEPARALRLHLEHLFGEPAPELPAENFVSYKYLASLDGAVAAWKRVPTILASGSVLLLQHRWQQFFYPAMKPWVHYVPLHNDLSDLIERYYWLVDHPTQAKTIAENGQRFAREVLNPAALEGYFAEIINECSQLYGQ
jgi:hypothetical protein